MTWLLLLACTAEMAKTADSASPVEQADDTLRAALQLRLPLAQPEKFSLVVGVDHDPAVYDEGMAAAQCLDYAARSFPHCYDEHDGSDFILEGGFSTMDAGSVEVVAAASGVVVAAEDGHYDRCHADLGAGEVSCDGHEMIANSVIVEHAAGHRTLYWHLMQGSVAVAVGDTVAAGDVLGKVGSSGNSSMPHLHFELQDAAEAVIDPYAGELSQPETWWCQQNGQDDLPGMCE